MIDYCLFKDAAIDAITEFLSFSYPKEAREIAEKLSSRYITIKNAMCSDRQELAALIGDGPARMVKLAAALISRKGTDLYPEGGVYREREIESYLTSLFFGVSRERVYVLLFDDNGALVGTEMVGSGTVNSSDIATRMIIEIAREYGVNSLAIAHNHPHGISRPSKEDVVMTEALSTLLANVGIKLTAHYVVAESSCERIGGRNNYHFLFRG